MTFADLYGEELHERLGSSQTTLFTAVRRKRAINLAQEWFVTQTECLTKIVEIALVSGVGEYDIEDEVGAAADFLKIAKQGAELVVTQGGRSRYLAGDDLPVKPVEWLNRYRPQWRAEAAGEPEYQYQRAEGGEEFFGLCPAPSVASGTTWLAKVPYVVRPADMVADADEPFTVDGNSKVRLTPWHDALADYAAHKLEGLRKGTERQVYFKQKAEARVLDYLDKQRTPGGKSISLTTRYRSAARSVGLRTVRGDWRDVRD